MTLDWFSAQAISGVINTLVPAILLAAGTWLLLASFPKLNASTRYAAWWAVLLAILCLPILRWMPDESAAPVLQLVAPASRHIDAEHKAERRVPGHLVPSHAEPLPVEHAEPAPETVRSFALPLRLPTGKVALLLAAIWAAGVLAFLVRLLLSYLDLRGILRRAHPLDPALLSRWTQHFGIRRPVRLLTSDEIGSPLAAGFWRPAVLVPECLLIRLDDDLADHVVIHELAHLGRRDDWANLLGRLLEAVLWFHPVARFILRRLEFERELACDDWVVAAAPSRRSYASSLTRLAEWRMDGASHMLAASMVGRGSQVGRRVRSLLDPRRNAAVGISRGVLVFAIVAIGGLLLCAAQTPGLVAFADDPEVEAPELPPSAAGLPQAPTAPRILPTPPSPVPAPGPVPAPARRVQPVPFAMQAPAPDAPPPTTPPRPPQAPSAQAPSAPGFLAALAQAGYGNLDVDEIVELKVQGVTADFIRQMNTAGFGKLTTRQLVEIRVHGVTPTYLADLKKAGISGYTLEQAKELKIHGVRPAEVTAIHALGFGPYDARQVVELRIHGVREDFFRALKDHGFTKLSHHDIVEAKIHGVSADNLREAQKYGQGTDIRRVIKLKQAGVL